MINQEKIPVREFKIKDENGREFGDLEAISIVSDPAHEMTFQLFKNINETSFSSVLKSDKMQITGVAMVPYKKILRQDENKEYYMGWFSEQTIIDCAQNYLRKGRNRSGNLEHLDEFSKDFYVFESWIVTDPENDKCNALGFKDIPKGTWFVTYQVTNKEKWNAIKNGSYKGFSVEVDAALFNSVVTEEDIKSIVFDSVMTDDEKELKLRELLK
jgi:hypothetical protein